MALLPRQRLFVNEYLVDFNGTQAALRAGYSENGVGTTAFNLLQNTKIQEAIEERQLDLAARAGLTVEWVLRQWKEIAEADPSKLQWLEVDCCHHCYGIDHEYQWSDSEFRQACERAAAHRCTQKCVDPCMKRLPPAAPGGFGYDRRKAPIDDCPFCRGNGIPVPCIGDTRRLKGPERRLYAGMRVTQHGIEIKMADQAEARKNIAQWLGMMIEKKEIAGPGGGPITLNVTADDLSDDQLIAVIMAESGGTIEGTLGDGDIKQLTA